MKIRWTHGKKATPAGCGWTWSGAHHLSHQQSQNRQTRNGVVGGQYR